MLMTTTILSSGVPFYVGVPEIKCNSYAASSGTGTGIYNPLRLTVILVFQ
jgi:hypothetical protein